MTHQTDSSTPEDTARPGGAAWKVSDETLEMIHDAAPRGFVETIREGLEAAVAIRALPDPRLHGEGKCIADVAASVQRRIDAMPPIGAAPLPPRGTEEAEVYGVGREVVEQSIQVAKNLVAAWVRVYEVDEREDALADLRFSIGQAIRNAVRVRDDASLLASSRRSDAAREADGDDDGLARAIHKALGLTGYPEPDEPSAGETEQWAAWMRDVRTRYQAAARAARAWIMRTAEPSEPLAAENDETLPTLQSLRGIAPEISVGGVEHQRALRDAEERT